MGEKPGQIERHIEQTRNELGRNLSELQQKVKSAVDWHAQFQQRPMTMIGLAFGGGMLLSTFLGGQSKPRRSGSVGSSEYPATKGSSRKGVWGNIKSALIVTSASKAAEFLEQIVPGFQEQYRKAEQNTS